MRRVGVERLRRVLTKPGVVRVESVGSRDVPGVRQTVGVTRVLVGVPGGRLDREQLESVPQSLSFSVSWVYILPRNPYNA